MRLSAMLAAAAAATTILAAPSSAEVKFFTCVGGASGMTLQLNPFAAGGVQRGCAPKMMDITLKQKNTPPDTGTVKYAYTAARMRADQPEWSEPTTFASNQVKFTGDKSQCEIAYLKLSNGDILYGLTIRADSVLGLRFVVNRQKIYEFAPLASGKPTFVDINGNAITDPDWAQVVADINARLASGGIPIEGGLSECYIDSGVRAIDRYNRLFPPPPGGTLQPQLNPANFRTTKDNILAVAVLAVIYNSSIEQWTGGQPLNITNQMMRMIMAGQVDNWDVFFGAENGHMPLLNFYREPLSGTGITFLNLIMRGLETNPNGTVLTEVNGQPVAIADDGTNYHRSGIPDLTCAVKPSDKAPGFKPGGGAVNNAVDLNPGAIAYTFLQKFTPVTAPALQNIRVAKFNGYEPYDFSRGNSLPGINGVPDVNTNTSPSLENHYFKNVIDGKYPLWTYNHCFDATNGQSQNLQDYVANFRLVGNAPLVREVGLIPLDDMNTFAATRTVSTSGPNAGRGPGLGRGGFVSPITGEVVRDGMMMLLNDPDAPDGLPGEGYVEMRP
ncbi:MAG: hypothetical protein ACUVS8_06690 [Armatimonadota bacterium]